MNQQQKVKGRLFAAAPPCRKFMARPIALSLVLAWLTGGCVTPGPTFHPYEPSAPSVRAGTNDFAEVTVDSAMDPRWLQAPTNLFTLGPGDQVEIEIVGEPASRATALVGPDGKIYYYLLPGLRVWGLTLGQTKELLERELAGLIRNGPKVTLALRAVESKRVWLLGRLNTPGIHPLAQPMTLLEAISVAGGPASVASASSLTGAPAAAGPAGEIEEMADLRHSFVLREGRLLPVDFHRLLREGDLSQNIYLQPDDFVYLPTASAREVYVLGAVGLPQPVRFTDSITLISAIASAGGPAEDAYLSHVAVIRGSLTQPRVAIVDYRGIVKGKSPDVALEPRDIVYVPLTPYRTVTRYVELVLDTFARTVGANEGARAVSRSAVPVGVNVPVDGITLGR